MSVVLFHMEEHPYLTAPPAIYVLPVSNLEIDCPAFMSYPPIRISKEHAQSSVQSSGTRQ